MPIFRLIVVEVEGAAVFLTVVFVVVVVDMNLRAWFKRATRRPNEPTTLIRAACGDDIIERPPQVM